MAVVVANETLAGKYNVGKSLSKEEAVLAIDKMLLRLETSCGLTPEKARQALLRYKEDASSDRAVSIANDLGKNLIDACKIVNCITRSESELFNKSSGNIIKRLTPKNTYTSARYRIGDEERPAPKPRLHPVQRRHAADQGQPGAEPRGRPGPQKKLTDENILEINTRWGNGEKPKDLAGKFGISLGYLYQKCKKPRQEGNENKHKPESAYSLPKDLASRAATPIMIERLTRYVHQKLANEVATTYRISVDGATTAIAAYMANATEDETFTATHIDLGIIRRIRSRLEFLGVETLGTGSYGKFGNGKETRMPGPTAGQRQARRSSDAQYLKSKAEELAVKLNVQSGKVERLLQYYFGGGNSIYKEAKRLGMHDRAALRLSVLVNEEVQRPASGRASNPIQNTKERAAQQPNPDTGGAERAAPRQAELPSARPTADQTKTLSGEFHLTHTQAENALTYYLNMKNNPYEMSELSGVPLSLSFEVFSYMERAFPRNGAARKAEEKAITEARANAKADGQPPITNGRAISMISTACVVSGYAASRALDSYLSGADSSEEIAVKAELPSKKAVRVLAYMRENIPRIRPGSDGNAAGQRGEGAGPMNLIRK
ncbi:MAG: hypothetical protein KGH60_01385 [Candidatus Micrarchaeota archaeon]|nr:hypothetical protein [Candidatus Micrarchaeota archaeon]